MYHQPAVTQIYQRNEDSHCQLSYLFTVLTTNKIHSNSPTETTPFLFRNTTTNHALLPFGPKQRKEIKTKYENKQNKFISF